MPRGLNPNFRPTEFRNRYILVFFQKTMTLLMMNSPFPANIAKRHEFFNHEGLPIIGPLNIGALTTEGSIPDYQGNANWKERRRSAGASSRPNSIS